MLLLTKKSEVHFGKDTSALLKKQYVLEHVVLGATSVLTSQNDVP